MLIRHPTMSILAGGRCPKTGEEYKQNVQKFNQETRGTQTGTEELAGVPIAFD
jgi:hypothetical protein